MSTLCAKGSLGKNCRNCFTCGNSTHITRNCPWNKRTEQTKVIKVCSTNKTKCLNVELLLNGKLVTGMLDSGVSFLLINFDVTERLEKPRRIKAFNNKVLAANNSTFKIVGGIDMKIQMKPKSGEYDQELLITADNCLPCLWIS